VNPVTLRHEYTFTTKNMAFATQKRTKRFTVQRSVALRGNVCLTYFNGSSNGTIIVILYCTVFIVEYLLLVSSSNNRKKECLRVHC
jgi:hypothetical protein